MKPLDSKFPISFRTAVDPLDGHYVETRPYSGIPGAGEGLFAKVDIPEGTTLALYTGFVFRNEEQDKFNEKAGQLLRQGLSYEDPELDSMMKYRFKYTSNFRKSLYVLLNSFILALAFHLVVFQLTYLVNMAI